jgi:cold shock CspA family protein
MPQFVKTRAKGMDVFVNMNAIFTVTHGKGFSGRSNGRPHRPNSAKTPDERLTG